MFMKANKDTPETSRQRSGGEKREKEEDLILAHLIRLLRQSEGTNWCEEEEGSRSREKKKKDEMQM